MSTEQPLVTWDDIAAHLKVCVAVARKEVKTCPKLFRIGRRVAVYKDDLKEYLTSKENA